MYILQAKHLQKANDFSWTKIICENLPAKNNERKKENEEKITPTLKLKSIFNYIFHVVMFLIWKSISIKKFLIHFD